MLFRIGAPNIGWAAIFIYLPFTALAIHILTRSDCYGDAAAIERHLADFPYERGLPIWLAPFQMSAHYGKRRSSVSTEIAKEHDDVAQR
jgi:hypothetical protein